MAYTLHYMWPEAANLSKKMLPYSDYIGPSLGLSPKPETPEALNRDL